MANLIIDIGNTALKASWADGITLGKTFRYQGERMLDFILSLTRKNRPQTMVLSSVRTFSQQSIERLSQECDRLITVDSQMLSKYGLPESMTSDRAASIIATRFLFKGIIVHLEPECFHVFNHKNSRSSGIAFTERMYLPNI